MVGSYLNNEHNFLKWTNNMDNDVLRDISREELFGKRASVITDNSEFAICWVLIRRHTLIIHYIKEGKILRELRNLKGSKITFLL